VAKRVGVRMGESRAGSLDREGVAALTRMEEALHLLDSIGVPLETGAHLDLAICRLRDALNNAGIVPPERNQSPFD
jgi:hypothetical protein